MSAPRLGFKKENMPKQISISKIVNAVLDGFKESQDMYEIWTGGFWLWEGPEYLITTNVARKLFEVEGAKYITLENGSTAAIKNAGAKGRGRLPIDIREKGKVDILLWWGNDTPRAIIEIKNQIFSSEQYVKDIKRIKSFLQRNGKESSLQFGIFAFYDSAKSGKQKSARVKVERKIDRIFNNSKLILGSEYSVSLHSSDIYEQFEEDAWAAACILIKRKNT